MLHPRSTSASSDRSGANASARARSSCSTPTATMCPTARSEALRQRPLHLRRLLEAAGKDEGGVPRRLLHGRRHGARDADGYIHLVDRKSNMIISGGENVYPSEVEALLAPTSTSRTSRSSGSCRYMGRARARGDRSARRGPDDERNHRLVPQPHRRLQASAIVLFIGDEEMPRTATGKPASAAEGKPLEADYPMTRRAGPGHSRETSSRRPQT